MRKLLFVLAVVAGACLGQTPVGPPDTACNPTLDTPAANGCTWYNFTANTNNTITAGSGFTNYYVPAGNPPWTFTSSQSTVVRVLDGGHQGDVFSLYDNGVFVGQTSATPIDA